MTDSHTEPQITLHAWPGRWDLPSIQPESLAAILLLQLAIPGEFSVEECVNPDLSPSGQLPYLALDATTSASLPAIIKRAATIKSHQNEESVSTDLDSWLDSVQRSQKTAWIAYAQAHLGDLVAHALFGCASNYWKLTQPTLASMLPLPQRYYVPGRVRDSYKPRLEAAGLWNSSTEDERDSKKHIGNEEQYKHAFGQEKVSEKARNCLDVLKKLLGDQHFFYGDRPSTLDVIIAAHVLLLLDPPFRDNTIKTLLATSYAPLTSHARRIHAAAFAPTAAPLRVLPPPRHTARALLPWPVRARGSRRREKTEEEHAYDRMRWGWYALAALAVTGWMWRVYARQLLVISFVAEDEGVDLDGADEEEGEEEGEEDDDVDLHPNDDAHADDVE